MSWFPCTTEAEWGEFSSLGLEPTQNDFEEKKENNIKEFT